MAAQGSQLTNKYAEGYPGKRYYGGCEFVDIAEQLAIDRVKKLFGAEYANVQPHSGAQANQAVFFAMLKPGDTILGMSLAARRPPDARLAGQHLGQAVQRRRLRPRPQTEAIDYDAGASGSRGEHKPKLIVAGASAYSRVIDWKRFRAIADAVGALLMVDMAHYAGLIAAGLYPSPVGIADFVPAPRTRRCADRAADSSSPKPSTRRRINSAIFPGPAGRPADARDRRQGGGVRRGAAAEFKVYQEQVLENARVHGQGAAGARPAHRLRRHRLPHVPGRPAREEDHRQGRRSGARPRAHHGQQERDPQRSGEAVRHQRHPHRQPGDDDARLHRVERRAARRT